MIEDWCSLSDPAELFLAIWSYITSYRVQRADLASAMLPAVDVTERLETALKEEGDNEAVRALCQILSEQWTEIALPLEKRKRAGLALASLHAIDDAFEAIHPRTGLLKPGTGIIELTAWQRRMRERRLRDGFYARIDQIGLAAKGPFARASRTPADVSSFSLAHQCHACAVVPTVVEDDGRQVAINIRVIDQGIAGGVTPKPGRTGKEMITLAPLAEATDDLKPEVREDEATHFLDIVKGANFAPQSVFAHILIECGASDVLLLPELVVDEADVAAMREALACAGRETPSIVLCGSGLVDNGEDRPWNQADVVNELGVLLWSHRKVFAYCMLENTFRGLNIEGVKDAKRLLDDISWSNEITIADIEGMGRCIVLICQDFMMEAVEVLVEKYQPDWVFVPILDSGTGYKRWPFRRAVDLSAKGPARFVVVSSLTMLHWCKESYDGEHFGVAVGPRNLPAEAASDDKPRQVRQVACESSSPRYATIVWRDDNWDTLGQPGISTDEGL